MSALPEADKSEDLEFKWGKKKGLGKQQKNIQFYESFTYDGVEYTLHDCVYLYKEGEPEPYIGKLAKIWEHIDKWKRVKVQWFFRPSEISYYLKDEKLMNKELFFASGQGVGLSNVNPLEAVSGKCNIICISKDSRNPKPSNEELETADYVFYRTFNVDTCTISEEIGDKVGDLEVKFIFNRKSQIETLSVDEPIDSGAFEDRPSKRVKLHSSVQSNEGKDLSSIKSGNEDKPLEKSKIEKDVPEIKKKLSTIYGRDNGGGEAPLRSPSRSDVSLYKEKKNEKKTNKLSTEIFGNEKKIKRSEIVEVTQNPTDLPKENTKANKSSIGASNSEKRTIHGKIVEVTQNPTDLPKEKTKTNKSSIGASNSEKRTIYGKIIEVTRRPNPDTINWFRERPWDERIQSGQDEGKLALLQNLDPEYTSGEVEDIIYHAFEENCTSKMVQHTAVSSPHCGQALVIFKSKDAADRVIRRLQDGCLMLSNGRPLVGRMVNIPRSSGKQSNFVGHLFIDKLKHKMPKGTKEAVSTSHYSQPNTIEFEMAMDWFTLQARSDVWWRRLYQQQADEIKKLRVNLKSK